MNAQLIATETGAHLWADRFDQKLNDLSAGQEEIVRRIGQTLNVALVDIESARSKRERPTNPDAFDLILRARSLAASSDGSEGACRTQALFEQALRLDPNSIYAMTQLAFESERGSILNADEGEHDRAAKLIADAAAINPNDLYVLEAIGHITPPQWRYDEAIAAYQRLLDEYPNSHWAYIRSGSACPVGAGRRSNPDV